MDRDEVLLEVKWTVEDVANAFSGEYGREPTDEELDVLLKNLDIERMEDLGIGEGWNVINEAVSESESLINDLTRVKSKELQEKICGDFEVSKEELDSLTGEIKESNREMSNRELNEEIAFRLIEESVDMHGFNSLLDGKAVLENEANPDGKAVISSDVNSQIMEAHSEILEDAAAAYVSGELEFNKLQNFIDEQLKENELYKGFEKTGVLTDFIQENKELHNGERTRVFSFSPFGYDGCLVSIETDLRKGIPAYDIVGISDGVVRETRERIRCAVKNSGLDFPPERILQSFSPADLRKDGGMYLAAALDLINVFQTDSSYQEIPKSFIDEKVLVLGDLDLSGKILSVRGVLPAVEKAAEEGITHVICNDANYQEISSVPGIKVCVCNTLDDAVHAIESPDNFRENSLTQGQDVSVSFPDDVEKPTMNLDGYYRTARAIEVAAAGKHNILLTGAPGCGKTIAVQQLLPYLTPCLTDKELESVNKIKSIAGLSSPYKLKSKNVPFRMPHQTATIDGMVGGGIYCRPGEISLAHNGVLFLDEAAEFRASALQMLRVPLESKYITLSRAGRTTVFPADFQLAMATNPCPCGNFGCSGRHCIDSKTSIDNYWKKFSTPLLDRVEIKDFVEKNENDRQAFDLEGSRERIKKAVEIQRKRGTYNSHLNESQLRELVTLDDKGRDFFTSKLESEEFSHREVLNMLRLSLTLANMEGREKVLLKDLKEAYNLALPVLEKNRSVSLEKEKEKTKAAELGR